MLYGLKPGGAQLIFAGAYLFWARNRPNCFNAEVYLPRKSNKIYYYVF